MEHRNSCKIDRMFSLLNQYSYIWITAAIIFVAVFLLWRKSSQPWFIKLGLIIVFVGGFVFLWGFIRPKPGAQAKVDEIAAEIGNGFPVLLEFQSPY